MSKTKNVLAFFIVLSGFLALCSGLILAQGQTQEEKESKYWTVAGYRHGPSFFPRSFYEETRPLQKEVMDFKHYHTYTEMVWWFKKWAGEYPDLVDLYIVAKSFGGRDIYQLTLTNKKTGKDTDKPAMFIDGNRHSGEVTAAESAFWMLYHMLTHYGSDPEITRLLDHFAFYFRPKNNPDGSLLYLETAQTLRSTIRPYDNDGDGLLDEDPAEDLDGDGKIRQMRVKVEKGKGSFVIDPRDPKGRLMTFAEKGEGEYNIMSEGIDNDGDGRINEDGVGGLDLHRNYPENWRPMEEATGRGFTQRGAGAYPLSEVETRSLVVFVLEHPNISVMNTMDTTVPMHLRPPSTSPSEERMYPEDLALYKHLDEKGKEITGYERAGDVYQDYGRGRPLFGHSPDFGYWYYGSIWYGDELWNGGRIGDYDENGETDEWDRLQYNDRELLVSRFQDWTKVIHPEYGEVEVGGWDGKFYRQNPPPELLEEWAEKEARFNLMLAGSLPMVEMRDPIIRKRNGDFTVEVELENKGFLPTALKQALLVKIVRPDRIELEFPPGVLPRRSQGRGRFRGMFGGRPMSQEAEQTEKPKVEIIAPEKGQPYVDIGRIPGNDKVKVTFKLRLKDIESTKCTVRYTSTRGGVLSKDILIGN
ncbi:MAG: peptidase [Candidatus Aminicenantes bacterium]|nr:MAG: peptidase [Candidatus Aminicenantes bacterium]